MSIKLAAVIQVQKRAAASNGVGQIDGTLLEPANIHNWIAWAKNVKSRRKDGTQTLL